MLLNSGMRKTALAFHVRSLSSMFSLSLVQQVRQRPADIHLATPSAGSGPVPGGALAARGGSVADVT